MMSLESARTTVDFATADKSTSVEVWFDADHARLSARMIEKLKEAKARGLKAYDGWLDSEKDMIQTFFCTDWFEVENEEIYFDALECVW